VNSRKGTWACGILFFLAVILIDGAMPLSFSQNPLSYVVELSMSNRRTINVWRERVNLTFTISGLVDFLNGSVQVHSDTANLLVNTFRLEGYYVGADGVTYQWLNEYPRSVAETKEATARYSFRGINCEWIDYDVCSKYSMYRSAIRLAGSLILDSSATNSGSHQVEVVFLVHTATKDYRFSNSISYEIVDFWRIYYWVPLAMLAAIIIFSVGFLRLRRH
jgi:hypothetical protein